MASTSGAIINATRKAIRTMDAHLLMNKASQSNTEEIGIKLGAMGADTTDSQKPNILLHRLSRHFTGKSNIAGDFIKARSSEAGMENEAGATAGVKIAPILNQFRKKQRNRRQKRNLLTDLIKPHMNSHGLIFPPYRVMTLEEAKVDFNKYKKTMESMIRDIKKVLRRTDLDLPQEEIIELMYMRDSIELILDGGHTLWQEVAG